MNPRPEHFDALAYAIRTCSSPNRRRDLEEIRSFLSTVSADLSDIDDGEPDDNDDNDIASLKGHIAELEARCKAQHEVMTDMVAERDSLRDEIAAAYRDRASSKSVLASVIGERDALQSKIDSMNEAMHSIARRQVALEEEAEERQSIGLRERLVCAALTGMLANSDFSHGPEDTGDWAARYADATLAAMRKGATDEK